MLPAERPLASLSRISCSVVQAPGAKPKNPAASVAIRQSCRNRTGQVIVGLPPFVILQTPSGSSALSFVQFGTLLLNGHSLCSRCRFACSVMLSGGKPNTSSKGLLVIYTPISETLTF